MNVPFGGPAVRIIRRSDDAQLRLVWLPTIGEAGALDCRLFRRSPNVDDTDEEYSPTAAGFCIPRSQLREVTGALAEIIGELER